MSASHQLTEQQRTKLLTGYQGLPSREMVRYWLLAEEDVRSINARRREMRPVTKRDGNLQVLSKEYRFRPYGPAHSPLLRRYLETEALSIDSAFTSVESAMEWLRQDPVILPGLATLEAVVRAVRSKVERDVYWRLFHRLGENQKTELNQLLELGSSRGSLLGWLRHMPRSCSPAGILDLMQRLNWVQALGVPRGLADGIAGKRIDQLAARGARHSVANFRRFPLEKRYAILAVFLLNLAEELTDRSMDFHRRLIGRLFRASEKKQWAGFVQQGPSVNEKLHNYAPHSCHRPSPQRRPQSGSGHRTRVRLGGSNR